MSLVLKPRFYAFWAVNARFDEREMCRQLDSMRGFGFDGTVFHPRFYPNDPPYLSDAYLTILSRVILHAQSIGLDFWIYDENGWPSGTVGGELLRQFPEDAQQWADLVTEEPPPADCLARFEHQGRGWFLTRRRGAGVDYFSPQLAQHFIKLTYERYRKGLAPAAFDHVSAFFCDEPEFGLGHAYDSLSKHGSIPWTPRLPEIYHARCGEKLEPRLPLLFLQGEAAGAFRVKFWELLTDLFSESFVTPLDNWCREHGKRFTAHVKGEEHPLFQVPTSGSCHQVFKHIGLPAIDALERFPSGHFFPRQVASVTQQFGNGECMVECFGGAGWGASPADFEIYLNWLAGHGLTHFVTHLWQYQLTTHAIQDWPPSHPVHVNWAGVYPLILDRIRKKYSAPRFPADTLLVAPYRGIMAAYLPAELLQTNVHNAATYHDTVAGKLNSAFLQLLDRVEASGVNYHVSDERTIEAGGKIKDGLLTLGHGIYRNVILADGVKFDSNWLSLLSGVGREATSSSRRLEEVRPVSSTGTVMAVDWKVQPGTINDFVLEAEATGKSRFTARFESAIRGEMKIVFADDVQKVTANGHKVGDDKIFLSAIGQNEIHFTCLDGRVTPFLSVRGTFAVHSSSHFTAGPNGIRATEGPFLSGDFKSILANDLLAAGFPFCREAVLVQGEVNFQHEAGVLHIPNIEADCVHLTLDNAHSGWCWGPDWQLQLPNVFPAGRHVIHARLVPSTFNFYGPHHHVDGDRHVVSPAQYQYVKNFADRSDAPANTRVNRWHFKPFGIGPTFSIS